MPERYLGSTARIQNTLRDFDDSLLTPDSQEVKWYDSKGTLKYTDTTPTLVSTGIYYSQYNIPADAETGTWKVVWKAVKGTYTDIKEFTFEVKKAP